MGTSVKEPYFCVNDFIRRGEVTGFQERTSNNSQRVINKECLTNC